MLFDQKDFSQNLKKQLTLDLPGWEYQSKLSPVPNQNQQYRTAPESHKKAAVLSLLYFIDHELYVSFIKRASHYEQDKHKGQISFPGGQLEPKESLLECVVRETHEEVGVAPSVYEILGKLSPIYVFVSNFLVTPFVAFANEIPSFQKDPSEVEDIIQWPVSKLLQGIKHKDISVREFVMKDAPYYPLNEEVLWGATAMITSELLQVLRPQII